MSTGTRGWIAEFLRLLERCTAQARKGDFSETRAAIEICFALLRRIDECEDDIQECLLLRMGEIGQIRHSNALTISTMPSVS